MPEIDNGHFGVPDINATPVGGKGFYIYQDPIDGDPTLYQTVKTRQMNISFFRRILHPDGLSGLDSSPDLYPTADEAVDEFLALQQWCVKHLDLKRPGDRISFEGIQRKVNALMRMKMKPKETAAAATGWLENRLRELGWDEIPVQSHLIGEQLRTAEGATAVLGGVELDRPYDPQTYKHLPLQLRHFDENWMPITPAEVA